MSKKNLTPPEKPVSTGPGYLEVIIIGLIVALLAMVVYDNMFAQKIKVIDLKGYLRTQKALLARGNITQEQWKVRLDTVEQVVNDAAANHQNHVIILKDVVLKNGDEIILNK